MVQFQNALLVLQRIIIDGSEGSYMTTLTINRFMELSILKALASPSGLFSAIKTLPDVESVSTFTLTIIIRNGLCK